MSDDGKELRKQDIHCLKHLRRVLPLPDRLHDCGCARDKAGDRELFFDDYVKLVLLYTWNPLINSMRMLQRTLGLSNVAKTLGVKRFSLGSFSESPRVFEPHRLLEIIKELAGELRTLPKNPRLADLKQALTLVDGTVLAALPKLATAAARKTRYATAPNGRALYGWRLHTHFDLETFTPRRVDRTGAGNSGDIRESNMLAAKVEPDRCYVMDGGYGKIAVLKKIIDTGGSFVCRVSRNAAFTVLEERELSQAALDANVVRDALAQWGDDLPMRLVAVQVAPAPRGGGNNAESTDLLPLAANLLDLPAELVGLIYQQRYTIELFFRFLKQLLGVRHLISERAEGIDVQVYCAVIVCLLINLMTGKKPNKMMTAMVGFYMIGLASEQELIDYLNKPDNTGIKKKAKDDLWKKLGF